MMHPYSQMGYHTDPTRKALDSGVNCVSWIKYVFLVVSGKPYLFCTTPATYKKQYGTELFPQLASHSTQTNSLKTTLPCCTRSFIF